MLVSDSGSSSLKFSLFDAEQERLLAEGSIDWTTRPSRLVFRYQGHPEIREELRLREHRETPCPSIRAAVASRGQEFWRTSEILRRITVGTDEFN